MVQNKSDNRDNEVHHRHLLGRSCFDCPPASPMQQLGYTNTDLFVIGASQVLETFWNEGVHIESAKRLLRVTSSRIVIAEEVNPNEGSRNTYFFDHEGLKKETISPGTQIGGMACEEASYTPATYADAIRCVLKQGNSVESMFQTFVKKIDMLAQACLQETRQEEFSSSECERWQKAAERYRAAKGSNVQRTKEAQQPDSGAQEGAVLLATFMDGEEWSNAQQLLVESGRHIRITSRYEEQESQRVFSLDKRGLRQALYYTGTQIWRTGETVPKTPLEESSATPLEVVTCAIAEGISSTDIVPRIRAELDEIAGAAPQ